MSSLKRRKRSILDSDGDDDGDLDANDTFRSRTQSKTKKRSDPIEGFQTTSELLSTLTECGLTLDGSRDPEILHSLQCEQAVFQRKMEQKLQNMMVEVFVQQLLKYLDVHEEVLLKAMMPVRTCFDSSHDPESLVRILLNVECLQTALATFLLEKLALISLESSESPLPKLILNSLRWLNVTKNGQELSDKLIEILDATPDQVQVEIISSLPEIIPDDIHDQVAQELKKLLKKTHLTATILDTFTNLSIKPQMSLQLRENVLLSIKDAPKDDLPIMVKFIVASTTPSDAMMDIDALRDNLNIDKEINIPGCSSIGRKFLSQQMSQVARKSIKNEDYDTLVLDVIRVAMTSEVKISDAWFTAIDKGTLASDQKLTSLDFLVLIHLYDLPNKTKKVESLIKNKMRAGKISDELIKKCFEFHGKILRSQFEGVMSIAEMLMNAPEPILNLLARVIHVQAFIRLDRFCQQEVISDLATQIGTNPKTRDIALGTLQELAKSHTKILANFSLYISGFLDHITALTLPQVRQIMDILSTLAYNAPTLGKVLRDDLQMVIRKQITATFAATASNATLKQIGVIGAVAMVKNMCKKSAVEAFKKSEEFDAASSSSIGNPLVKQALETLDMVKTATKAFSSVAGLFMDELACIFDNVDEDLDKELVDWISDQMTNNFQDDFIVDVTEEDYKGKVHYDKLLPTKLAFGIDDEAAKASQEYICLNLAHIVMKSRSSMAVRLIPHFRLMSKCISKQQGGNLEDIDAVLGCPIWIVNEADTYDKCESLSSHELSVMCDIYFYSLNFFRELVNTFSISNDTEDRKKVIIRLKNIAYIQEKLKKVLAINLGYMPPSMLHLEDISQWQCPVAPQETKGKGRKKGGGTKRKAGQDITNVLTPNDSTATMSTIEDTMQTPDVDLDAYAPFFREWDLSVFKIFTYQELTIQGPDDLADYDVKDPKLKPKEFLMLMKDLNMKLNHALVAATNKKGFPGKAKASYGFSNLDQMGPSAIGKYAISLMENMLAAAEVLAGYFKNILDLYDNNRESEEIYKDAHFAIFNTCLEQIFECLKTILSWNGIGMTLLKLALSNFANRLDKVDVERLRIKDLCNKSLDYLFEFKGVIMSVSVANSHLKLMEAIYEISGHECDQSVIHKTSKDYLSRTWYGKNKEAEKGGKYNTYLENFLTLYLKSAKDDQKTLDIIDNYVTNGIMEMVDKNDIEEHFVTLNKATLGVHYKVLMNILVVLVKKVSFSSRHSQTVMDDQLKIWTESTAILQKMLDVIKKMSSPRTLLGPLLRNSRLFLDQFLKHGMSLMDKIFNRERDKCLSLLKSMQLCTRYLQYVCSFTRQKQDGGLAAQVPLLRKLLEQFVFRVKAMMALNNAVEAFWLGNLKHRDLQGKELESSQIVDEDEDIDDVEDEEDLSDTEISEEKEQVPPQEEEEDESLEY